jgi:hypothetical protein
LLLLRPWAPWPVELHGRRCSTSLSCPSPSQPSMASPSPARATPPTFLYRSPSSPEHLAACATSAVGSCAHGQEPMAHLPTIRGHQLVHVGPFVLAHHSTNTDEPPPAWIDKLPRAPLCKSWPGTWCLNSRKDRGLCAHPLT